MAASWVSTQARPDTRPQKLAPVPQDRVTGNTFQTVGLPTVSGGQRTRVQQVPGANRIPFPAGASGVPGGDIHPKGTTPPSTGQPAAVSTVPGGSSSSTPGAQYPSPLDSTYFQQLNNATLAATSKIDASNLQSSYGRIDLQNALDQLGYQQGLQTRQAQDAENARGGFALGHLGDTLGQLNRSFLDRQAADQQGFDRGEAARSAARAAISQGLTLEQAALAAAAADRASALAAKDPAVGGPSLTPAPAATPVAPAAPAATPPAFDTVIPKGWAPAPKTPDRPAGWQTPGRGDKVRTKQPASRRY